MKRWLASALAIVFALLTQTRAATLTGSTNGGVKIAYSPDGKYSSSLTVLPVAHIDGPTDPELKLLRDSYTKWTFADSATASGTINILQYDAFATAARGGADFAMLYDDGQTGVHTDYSWIQIGYAHNWGDKDNQTFNDAKFTNFPFYDSYTPISLPTLLTPTSFYGNSIWLNTTDYPQSKIQNPVAAGKLPAGDLLFQDEPWCLWSCIPPNDYSSVSFNTYLVSFTWNGQGGSDAGGTVTIRDGVHWGVRLDLVPEPSTLLLWSGLGAIALVTVWRRTKRQTA